MALTAKDLEAIVAALAAKENNGGEEVATEEIPQGTHFASLGFVAVGRGTDPGEGIVVQVPTKAGKLARVQTIQAIDVSPFNGEFGDWAYTYKRLKRGQ